MNKSVFAELDMPLSTPFKITSPFENRVDPFTLQTVLHEAVDMVNVNNDTRVFPLLDGVCILCEWYETTGYFIILQHVYDGQIYYSRYAHIKPPFIQKGYTVKKGQAIGNYAYVGRSTGAHVHVEFMNSRGQRIDWMTEYQTEQKKKYSLLAALLLY